MEAPETDAQPATDGDLDQTDTFQKSMELSEKNHRSQNGAFMSVLAELKVVMQKLVKQESCNEAILELFPVLTDDRLTAIESKICQENREIYMRLRALYPGKYHKSLKWGIICEDLVRWEETALLYV
ncbi:uncharacterized protein [Eurosta solidaginis]|uniref:uncharacterized protein isoform X2 n=1 Tax=Eurosta solidaginis TaxID=178769 RepID=UPI0035316501